MAGPSADAATAPRRVERVSQRGSAPAHATEQAPLTLAKIGSIENLVDHVVHPMIDSSFRNQASSSEAMSFMQDRADAQAKAEAGTLPG